MNRLITFCVVVLLFIPMAWLSSCWFFSKQATQSLNKLLGEWPKTAAYYVTDVEKVSVDHHLLSHTEVIRLVPNLPPLIEQTGNILLTIQQTSGPILFDDNGLSFGRAKWQLIFRAEDGNMLSAAESEILAKATLTADFSGQLILEGQTVAIDQKNWSSNGVSMTGVLNLSTGKYHVSIDLQSVKIMAFNHQLSFPLVNLTTALQHTEEPVKQQYVFDMHLSADHGVLIGDMLEKQSPLNLNGHGSIWRENGTLSSDMNVSVVNSMPLENKEAYFVGQARDWNVLGIEALFKKISKRADMLRQAKWALEDVETPEQQDFYRYLIHQANSMTRTSWSDLLMPMFDRANSELVIRTGVKISENEVGKLHLTAGTSPVVSKALLPLTGEIMLKRQWLGEMANQRFKHWTRQGWFKAHETTFESEISTTTTGLLLHSRPISWVMLKDELKQKRIDQ